MKLKKMKAIHHTVELLINPEHYLTSLRHIRSIPGLITYRFIAPFYNHKTIEINDLRNYECEFSDYFDEECIVGKPFQLTKEAPNMKANYYKEGGPVRFEQGYSTTWPGIRWYFTMRAPMGIWSRRHGPYNTEEEAQKGFETYKQTCLKGAPK